MIRKYYNHTLQTNPGHCEEEPQNINSHETPGRQPKQSNQLSIPHQNHKTRKDNYQCTTKQGPNTEGTVNIKTEPLHEISNNLTF